MRETPDEFQVRIQQLFTDTFDAAYQKYRADNPALADDWAEEDASVEIYAQCLRDLITILDSDNTGFDEVIDSTDIRRYAEQLGINLGET